MVNLILYFFIYSVLGYILETAYAFVRTGKLQKRQTMLYSPMCVVYGLGAVGMIISLSWAKGSPLLLFCGGFFVCSSIEYIVSLIGERRHKVLWWDYRDAFGNLKGRVCAFYSLCWGVVAILFFKFVHPMIFYFVSLANPNYKNMFCIIAVLYFINDMRATSKELDKFSSGEVSKCSDVFPYLKISP